jgi:quinolinate synthase
VPGVNVIVHPECEYAVCAAADYVGSTSFILKTIREAAPGTAWAVGTEIHLVNRVAKECPDKKVMNLATTMCLCATMFRINPVHLLWALEALLDGTVVNQISVAPEVARDAKVALDRMLALS